MDKNLALKIILVISICGILFSGYLSYSELTKQTCPIGGGCTTVFSLPTCVYGFFMYLLVFVICLLALRSKK